MVNACAYQSAFARFQAEPQRGVPGGSGRVPIGRPLVTAEKVWAPPWKPRPVWSKLSLFHSSTTCCDAPAARKGLIHRSLKKTLTDDMVWCAKLRPTTPDCLAGS